MYRLTVIGSSSGTKWTDKFYSIDEARVNYHSHVRGMAEYGAFSSVKLEMWVEGLGSWYKMAERVSDWHNSPVTHSYA